MAPLKPELHLPLKDILALLHEEHGRYADQIEANPNFKWYSGVLRFNAQKRREHKARGGVTLWEDLEVLYKNRWRWLVVKFMKEVVTGNIIPVNEEDFRDYIESRNAKSKGGKGDDKSEPRSATAAPSFKISQTRQMVDVEDDGYTIKEGFTFDQDAYSEYFKFVQLVNNAFEIEFEQRKENNLLMTDPKSKKRTKDTLIVKNDKIFSMISYEFSQDSALKDKARPNPFTSVKLKTKDTSVETVIKDYNTGRKDEFGNNVFDNFLVEGDVVDNYNVHKAIGSGDEMIMGVIDLHSVCYSSFGVSIPQKVDRLWIKKRKLRDIEEESTEMANEIELPDESPKFPKDDDASSYHDADEPEIHHPPAEIEADMAELGI